MLVSNSLLQGIPTPLSTLRGEGVVGRRAEVRAGRASSDGTKRTSRRRSSRTVGGSGGWRSILESTESGAVAELIQRGGSVEGEDRVRPQGASLRSRWPREAQLWIGQSEKCGAQTVGSSGAIRRNRRPQIAPGPAKAKTAKVGDLQKIPREQPDSQRSVSAMKL
jgi:hypothetical protein